jgi:hypothetical protein
MHNWKTHLLIYVLLLSGATLQAQLMSKIQDIFTNDIFFVQLKEVHATVQGEEGKAIPLFLEKTMKNPQAISLADFQRQKERYYALCKEYNGIIEDIIATIQGIDKLKDLREVSLGDFRDRIHAIGPKFEALFNELSKYHQEAAIVGILLDIYKLGKPIIQHLIQEKVETIKRILTEQLRTLKITPLPWEAAESVVASGRPPGNQEEVRAKLGLAAADHYRSLNLAPGSTMTDIQAAHAKLSREYAEEIAGSSNPEIKEFFQQLTTRVEAAKRYFDVNPPQVLHHDHPKPDANNPNLRGCAELKGEINGLLQASEFMTKEQLVGKLQQVISKY